ncbi:hypothetical protein ZIOFF_035509 [Zingiber officinale]|uniref:ACB domain-containing protein n=1 Tax=Zingiber officinale TaxID=94328 RepID=A0A8J5KXQ4_ZINOF|nr:hypothetical protein ZIOFF_035509 [Zingiber officinale]
MGDWLELCQAVIIGLVFSFLTAKLISVFISFKEGNLKVLRESDLTPDSLGRREDVREGARELEKENESFLEEDSDWEGIESTELDDAFAAATAFVAATAADKDSAKVSNDVQLQLYGLYKIATEGPCTVPQPSALKLTARAKCWLFFDIWHLGDVSRNAWQRLGTMPPEDAMQKYIVIINELYPSWADHSTKARDRKLEAIHVFAREGKLGELLTRVANGASVNSRDEEEAVRKELWWRWLALAADEMEAEEEAPLPIWILSQFGEEEMKADDSEGRTPLHWAVDRGHINVVQTLLDKNADVNAKDIEGQTPLHYAALCDREEIGMLLVQHKADPYMKDNDDSSPLDLATQWVFMTGSS